MRTGLCRRGLHRLVDSSDARGRCKRCRILTAHGLPANNTGVPDKTVARFRAMWLDGSWLPYTSLVMDELIDGMAVVLVRTEMGE